MTKPVPATAPTEVDQGRQRAEWPLPLTAAITAGRQLDARRLATGGRQDLDIIIDPRNGPSGCVAANQLTRMPDMGAMHMTVLTGLPTTTKEKRGFQG